MPCIFDTISSHAFKLITFSTRSNSNNFQGTQVLMWYADSTVVTLSTKHLDYAHEFPLQKVNDSRVACFGTVLWIHIKYHINFNREYKAGISGGKIAWTT